MFSLAFTAAATTSPSLAFAAVEKVAKPIAKTRLKISFFFLDIPDLKLESISEIFEHKEVLTLLRAMQHHMVSQDTGHHGFSHGHTADTNTWVMAAFGDEGTFITLGVDGLAFYQD
jgi:hypothetical protein